MPQQSLTWIYSYTKANRKEKFVGKSREWFSIQTQSEMVNK